MISQVFFLIAIIVVVALASWWVLLTIPVIGGAMSYIFLYSIPSYKESERIVSVTKSPMLNCLSETTTGSSTIRAFGQEANFQKKFISLINNNILAYQYNIGSWCWFSMRVSFMSIALMVVATSLCIWFRFEIDPVLIGMTLTYILDLQGKFLYTLYCLGDLEKSMVSIQRCF